MVNGSTMVDSTLVEVGRLPCLNLVAYHGRKYFKINKKDDFVLLIGLKECDSHFEPSTTIIFTLILPILHSSELI